MARFFHHILPDVWRKNCKLYLAFSWLCGLGFGVLVFSYAGNSHIPLMRMAATSHMSIVSLLSVLILPFLLSAFAVFCFRPQLLLAVSFGKAFSFAFVSISAIAAFGSAGWLVRLLLMFSEMLSLPLLFWFWLRYISGDFRPAPAAIFLTAALVFLIGSVDHCYISPMLARLIEF